MRGRLLKPGALHGVLFFLAFCCSLPGWCGTAHGQHAGLAEALAAPTAPQLTDLQQLLATANAEKDSARRHDRLTRAVALFDSLSVSGADALAGFDGQAFLSSVARFDLEYAKTLHAGDAPQAIVLNEVRDILPRIRDEAEQAELYIALGRVELATSGDPTAGLAAIRKANSLVLGLPHGLARDKARVGLIRLVLPPMRVSSEVKLRWSVSIDDHKRALNAMRAVAMSEVAHRRAGKAIFQAAALKDKNARAAALAQSTDTQIARGSFQRALITALAIDDGHSALRDAALVKVAQAQLSGGARPKSILAPYAITDVATRDTQLLSLSQYAIGRGRLGVARQLVDHVNSPSGRYSVIAGVATRLIREGFLIDWAATWDRAADAAQAISDPPQRRQAFLQLGLEAADTADAERADRARANLGAEAKAYAEAIRQRLAMAEIGAGKIDSAIEHFQQLAPIAGRGAVAASIYDALLRKGATDRAVPFAAAVDEAADRITLLLADASHLSGDPKPPEYDPGEAAQHLAAARAELAGVADPRLRDERIEAVARAYGEQADVETVDALLAMASEAGRPLLAPLRIGAVARGQGRDAATAALEDLPDDQRDRGLIELADVLSESGDAIAAFDVARQISGEHPRRRTLRRIAERQAMGQRDRGRDTGLTAAIEPAPEPLNAGISIKNGDFLLQAVSLGKRRDLPDVLSAAKATSNQVRATVPEIAPGTARLVPTGFSNFDEKFSYIRYLNNVDLNGGEEELLAKGQGTLFPSFVLVEDGVWDLPTLVARLEIAGETASQQPISNDGRIYQLNVPLLIGANATLVVTSSDVEELRLNTAAHSYIVNSGKLFIIDAKLTSWDPMTASPTPRNKHGWSEFSPFYTAWSGSETYMADAHVNGMGYANGKSYGISISSGPVNVLKATLNTLPLPKGTIVDSTFTDMYYAFYSYEASDFKLIGNEYFGNEIYAIDPHDRSERLTIAFNSAWGTRVKHGIITSRGVTNSVIVGNVSAENQGSGLMLDRSSDSNIVAYNLSFRNGGDGLTIYESSCALVFGNSFLANRRDGLKLRNSFDLMVSDNVIGGNHGFGVNLYASRIEDTPEAAHRDFKLDPYKQYADVVATGNIIDGNRKSALRSDEASAIVLSANRFSVDRKLFQQSDFDRLGPSLISLAGRGAALRNVCRPNRPPTTCLFRTDGYFGTDLVSQLESADGGVCGGTVSAIEQP